MMEEVTLDVAHRLFPEARDWSSGRTKFLAEDSEIRTIATAVFHQAYIMHCQKVCDEIFYVLACSFRDVPR
jgi:hypothetical protein